MSKNPSVFMYLGQAAVFYDNDIIIGGGWIENAENQPLTQFTKSSFLKFSRIFLLTCKKNCFFL